MGAAILLIGSAMVVDGIGFLLNLIPIVGNLLSSVISGLAWGAYWLIFRTRGTKFSKVGPIIELIPIVNMLPGWTVAVTYTLAREGKKTPSPATTDKSSDKNHGETKDKKV